MPCNQLAVQSASIEINEKVLAALFENEQAHAVLVELVKQQTGVSMSAYAYTDYSTGRKKVLSLSGGGIDIAIRLDGGITVRGVSSAETQRYAAVLKDALAAVAIVIVQNMVKTALVSAGVPVVADAYNAVGARVMTLRV